MKTMIRVSAAAGLLAVAALAVAPIVKAQNPPPGPPPMRGFGPGPGGPGGPGPMGLLGELGRGLRDLNVTDAQRTQIRSIVDSHNAEMRQIGDRMRTAREALDDAVTAETADEAAIRARVADVSAVEADAAVLRARVHAEVFGVLTPEQQARARELKAQMKQRMQQRIGARMERRRERRRVFGR